MHYTVAIFFWVAFLIPGFAVTMRWAPTLTKGGLMSSIAVSFLASLALFMPFTILGFMLNLPLWIISSLIVLSVIWGLIDLFKTGAWREWKSQTVSILRLEALVLGAACMIQGRIGSLMGADGLIHMARVRQIMDHGLTNVDPFIKGEFFYPIYHTNIYHVLLASCAQLTKVHYLDVWFGALPVMLVLIAAAIYFMTYQIFANRWASWFSALFFIADQGRVNFLAYPNKVAPFFLLPVLIGFAIRALRDKPTGKDAIQIGFTSMALGMFHGMYAFFGLILLGPTFLIFAIRSYRRQEKVLKKYALCLLALAVSLPWPIISKTAQEKTRVETIRARIERDRDPDAIQFVTSKAGLRKKKKKSNAGANSFFRDVGMGLIMKKPLRGFGGGEGLFGIPGFRYQYLLLGCIFGFLSKRRRQYAIAASVAGVTLVYLLFPPLCTLLYYIMEAKWMLQRMETAGLSMMFPSLVFGPIVYGLSQKIRAKGSAPVKKRVGVVALQGVISLALLSFAFSYSNQWASWYSPFTGNPWRGTRSWQFNYEFSQLPDRELQAKVRSMKLTRKFYQEKIPAGSNVIVTDNMALELVTLHDAHILDPIRSSVGVPDISYFRRLNARILNPITDWPTRRRILKYVGTNLYIPQRNTRWLNGHVKALWGMKKGQAKIIEIDLDS